MRYLRYLLLLLLVLAFAAGSTWYWLLHTTSGARWVLAQAESIAGLKVRSIDGNVSGGLEVRALSFTNDSVDLDIEHVTAAIDIDLFPASVEVVTATASKVDVRLLESSEGEQSDADVGEILRTLALPIPVRASDFRADEITLTRAGESQIVDSLSLVAIWYETIIVERLELSRPDFDAGLNASVDLRNEHAWNMRALVQMKQLLTGTSDVLPVTITANGYPDSVDIEAALGTFATIDGRAEWGEAFTAAANIVLDRWKMNEVVDSWPSGFPVSGKLNISLDDRKIALNDSSLEIGGTNALIEIDAELNRANDRIDGQFSWRKLRWPLPADETRVRSDTGNIRLSGTVDDWTVNGTVEVSAANLEKGMFVLDGRGTRNGVEGQILDSQLFGGRAAGQVTYSWVDKRPWSAVLDVTNLELGALLPDWPGRLSGHISGHGISDPFALQVEVEGVSGEVRGEDFEADGGIDIKDGEFIAHALGIAYGESRVILDGSLSGPEGLEFDGQIADVGTFASGMSGAVQARGRASLTDVATSFDFALNSPLFGIAGTEFSNVELQVRGTQSEQALQFHAEHLGTPVAMSLAGAFDNWREPLQSTWRGRVESFAVDLGDEHSMTLPVASPLELSSQRAAIQEFCIADATGSSLCADGAWSSDGTYSASSRMTDIPVNFIEHFVDTKYIFNQHLSGTFNWQHSAARTGGNGRLKLSAGQLISKEDGTSVLRTGEGIVDFEVENGTLLAADLVLPLPGKGEVSGDFKVLDVRALTESDIAGTIDIDITDLSALAKISSLVDSASGRLLAHADLSGTLGEPKVTANLKVSDTSISYLPLGLKLDELNMEGTIDENLRADLAGTFRAGKGRGQIVSRADYSDASKPGLQFKLKGDNLTLINVPDIFVAVDSDIDVVLDRETLTINGEVLVSDALIKPVNLTTTKISESDDVVIVAGELPDLQEEEAVDDGLQFAGELSVALGNSVVIDLDLARARVSGTTSFDWQGAPIPMANGRYDIAGTISAFGQVLEIEEGTVQFPNVPADQPFITINAEREIYGNTEVKRAGVLVDGPISQPTVEAYTLPLTTEERALTLLVTGSDFDYEQGVGAIDFGTYIAPRLFVSYGVGVFERENIISARYDLTKGFGIKASSGSKESGVDLNYRFEN